MQREISSGADNLITGENCKVPKSTFSTQMKSCPSKENIDLLKTLKTQQERMRRIENLVDEKRILTRKIEALRGCCPNVSLCSNFKDAPQMKTNICIAPIQESLRIGKEKWNNLHEYTQGRCGTLSKTLYGDSGYFKAKIEGYERMITNLCSERNSQVASLMELIRKKEAEIDKLRLKENPKSGIKSTAVEAEVSLLKEMIERCKSLLREGEKASKKKDKIIIKLKKELLSNKEENKEYKRMAFENSSVKYTEMLIPPVMTESGDISYACKRTIAYYREQCDAKGEEVRALKKKLASEEERAATVHEIAKEQIRLRDKLINGLNIKLKQLVQDTLRKDRKTNEISLSNAYKPKLEYLQDEAMNARQDERDTGLKYLSLRGKYQNLNNDAERLQETVDVQNDELAKKSALIIELENKELEIEEFRNMFDFEKADLLKKINELSEQLLMRTKEVDNLNKDLKVVKDNAAGIGCQEKSFKESYQTLKKYRSENREKDFEVSRLLKELAWAKDNLKVKTSDFERITKDMDHQLQSYRKQKTGLSKKISELTRNLKTTKRILLKKSKECLNLERKHQEMVNRIASLVPQDIHDDGTGITSAIERTFGQMVKEGANMRNDINVGVAKTGGVIAPGASDETISSDTVPVHTNNVNSFDYTFGKGAANDLAFELRELDNDLLFVKVNSLSSSKLQNGLEDSKISLQSIESCSGVEERIPYMSPVGEGIDSLEIVDTVNSKDKDDREISHIREDCTDDIVILENIREDKTAMDVEPQSMNEGFIGTYWPTWYTNLDNGQLEKKDCKAELSYKSTCDSSKSVLVTGQSNDAGNLNIDDAADDVESDFCNINIDDIIEL